MLWGHETDMGRVDIDQSTSVVEMGKEIKTSRMEGLIYIGRMRVCRRL